MGAWGEGSFENDDAMDWVAELEESGVPVLREMLYLVTRSEGEYVEVPECSRAVAAAEVVASLGGYWSGRLPPEVVKWVSEHRGTDVRKLVPLALRAVRRVRMDDDCELKELWDESDSREAWYSGMKDLEARLRKASKAS